MTSFRSLLFAALVMILLGVGALIAYLVAINSFKYQGITIGTQVFPSGERWQFVIQYDRTTVKKPVFVILWRSPSARAHTVTDSNNRLTQLDGHPVTVDFTRHAVYVRRSDQSLLEVPMNEADLNELVDMLRLEKPDPKHEEAIRSRIAPFLEDPAKESSMRLKTVVPGLEMMYD